MSPADNPFTPSPELSIEQRGPLHRVQLGPFKDRTAANAAAERVRALVDVKPVLVVR